MMQHINPVVVKPACPCPIRMGAGLAGLMAMTMVLVLATGCGREEPAAPSLPPAQPAQSTGPAVQLPTPVITEGASTNRLGAPPAGEGQQRVVRTVRGDEVMAVVNGREVRVRDLPGFGSGEEDLLTANNVKRMLEVYLNQEAVLREAVAQGLTLSAAEQEKVAQELSAKLGVDAPKVLTPSELIQGNSGVGNEQRTLLATVLLDQMMKNSGVPSGDRPISTSEVKAYYEQHARKYPAIPPGESPNGPVTRQVYDTIRQQLADQNAAAYKQAKANFVNELKKKSPIEIKYAADWLQQ